MSAKSLAASLLAACAVAALTTSSAFAGECPADQVRPNATPPGPMEPSGVTDEVISSIDLSEGYGVPGRLLRLRRLEMERGAIVPWHGHAERPANIYIVRGTVTEHRSTCAVPIVHRAGEVVAEQGDTFHWWENTGRRRAILLSADLLPPQSDDNIM